MKQTPKSCSCQQCTFGKHTKTGQKERKADERALRHKAKVELKTKPIDSIMTGPAPIGNYYD